MNELREVEGLESIVEVQGWKNIFGFWKYLHNVVRHFYVSLLIYRNANDEEWEKSYVNGVEISLTSSSVNRMLGLVEGGFKVFSLETLDRNLYVGV